MPEHIETFNGWSEGRLQLMVGLCEKIGIKDIFNKHLSKELGRPSDIPPGIEAEIMIAGICIDEGYRPLYAMQDYYEYKDLEGIFHHPIKLSQLNDDRFGDFLDDFYNAGPRKIFMEISARAFAEYGIAVRNINYDTTSKVMWGEYEHTGNSLGAEGEISHISIDFGHSKNKRGDKKQIKIGLGTTNGVITDAKVLSGNMDDKTYNKENLEDVDQLLTHMKVNRRDFYYIADAALFTAENIKRANTYDIMYITRMPDSIKVAKACIATPLPEDAHKLLLENAQGKKVTYRYIEKQVEHEGHACKIAVIHSDALEQIKRKSSLKNVEKEKNKLDKEQKKHVKRLFTCQTDAGKEVIALEKKSKSKYHKVSFAVIDKTKNRPGRPSKDATQDHTTTEYQIQMTMSVDESRVEESIRQECTFILCSNDLAITGEKLLREYKTQSDVEKRFKVLKSPQFMNSLFLKTPRRVEALVYLLLISLMMLTVAERVVQDELKKRGEVVYGIEKRKVKEPTLTTILKIMDRVRVVTFLSSGKIQRKIQNMDESCKKIIEFLRFPVNYFEWNGDDNHT